MSLCGCNCADTMADVNVNAPAEQAPAMAPPTRTDDQILPRSSWVPITPVNNNKPFSSPPTPDALIKFVNDLGYLKVVRTLSAVVSNDMHQLWRALTTIINLCLMEEFTQSIHSFVEDKKNLALHTQGKKKANPIVIPSVRFTKLIIHHLQSKHKFHPRPDSPLHLPYKEYVLGYLKFSAKVTKREVFGMPILNDLITADIRGGQYYNAYLEKVAKHQRYLASEEGSEPDSPAPKPDKATKPKATKKSKPSAPKAAPKKKRKLVKETSDEPSPAKGSKRSLVTKRRKQTNSLRLVDEFVDEGVPDNEPRIDDEEADLQRAVEESLKDVHATHRGPPTPVVAHTLLDLNTLKKKSTTDQYIFQRRTPKTADPTGPSIHQEDEKVTLTEVEIDTEELLIPTEKSGEEVSNTVVLGTESGGQDEKQEGPDPSDSDESRPLPSQGIHTGSILDPMDEGFIETAYPNVQENLKLTVEEQVILKEPASFTGTLCSLQYLAKDFSFGDQFFNDKPSKAENEKTTTETEAESMVSVTIQQDSSATPPMTSPVIDLISRTDSPNVHRPLPTTTTAIATTTTITTILLPPPQPQHSTIDSILIKRIGYSSSTQGSLQRFAEADMKEILHHRIWESNSYKSHEDYKKLYEALEKSMDRDQTDQLLTDLAEKRRKKKMRLDLPKTPPGSLPHQPPPPPPPAAAPSSSKTAASAEYTAWTTIDIRLKPSVSSIPEDLHMDDDSTLDEQVHSSDDEDIRNDHIPKVNLKQDWWKPLSEEDRPATLEPAWSIPSSNLPVP
ncbi:retrovirus-related pol polyprotein from transposon TNT 1-94 [Tanacetum coccineum]